MKRSRIVTGIGVPLTLLLLLTPADSAVAEAPPSGQQDRVGSDPGQQHSRTSPIEPATIAAAASFAGSVGSAGAVACGQVITSSTTLTADVGPCPGDGIIIGADGITLNLNGHTISGDPSVGDGNAAGIRLPFRSRVTVTGFRGAGGVRGTVTDFNAGVLINGGSRNNIRNLKIRDNIGPGGDAVLGDGIVLFHSAKNQLINNLVSQNGPFDGIGVLGVDSNDNRIQGNTVEESVSSEGDFVFDGVGILINNFLDEQGTPRRGEPIRNNDVIDNVVRRNDNSGISNVTNIGARIMRNVVRDNGQRGEICITFGGDTTCQPVASPSNGIGFTAGPLAPDVTRALIQGNTVTGNQNIGIDIRTQENRIIGNTVLRNGNPAQRTFYEPGDFDLYDLNFEPPCDNNLYRNNVFVTANLDCIYIQQGLESPLPPPPPTDGGPR